MAALEILSGEGHKVGGFFYNPNIHPYSEYLRRKSEVERYSKDLDFAVRYSDYEVENYFQHIVHNEAPKERCPVCWRLRLEKTALFARENGLDSFTTTLLASPYQDQDVIKEIGQEIAKRTGMGFYYKDFRPHFREAHIKAKSKGVYCQNYCGCVFSERERLQSKGL